VHKKYFRDKVFKKHDFRGMEFKFQPIPTDFFNSDTHAPFENCIECDIDLIETQSEYLVEKSVRRLMGTDAVEVLFEYAICMGCAQHIREKMSTESRERIDQHIMNRARPQVHDLIDDQLKTCFLSGNDIDQVSEYVVHAHCKGDQLVHSVYPYAIDHAQLEEIAELLSAKSRDEMDGFIERHFMGPPEFAELFSKGKYVLI